MDYTTALKLKELGFQQRRHDKAKYFINEDTLAYFEDIKNAFEVKEWTLTRGEMPVQWQEQFTYLPELIDFIGPQQMQLSIDSAAHQWINARASSDPLELVKRTENAIKTEENKKNQGSVSISTTPGGSVLTN